MMDFIMKEKGRLAKIGLGALMVGGNAGILYAVVELSQSYAGTMFIGMVTVVMNTAATALMDFKKKKVDEVPDEDV